MEKSARTGWIDAVRGISILAIIAFHSGFLPFIHISDPLLASWFLPAFLFTGGWLLKDTPLTARRAFLTTRRMLIPFFICGIVSFAGWMILRQVYPQHVLDQPVGQELAKWLTGRNPYFNSPLWFLPAYLVVSLVMRLAAPWWFRRRLIIRALLSVVFVAAGFLLSHPYRYPIFSYDLIVLFIGMMMMGSVASAVRLPTSMRIVVFDVSILVLFIVLSLSNGYVDMFQRVFGSGVLYILSAAAGTFALARVLQKIKTPLLVLLGRSSMSLMIWHWPVMQWLTFILFTTGLLQRLAVSFTKTSFILSEAGLPVVFLQIIFCSFYTAISILCIIAGNTIVRRRV